MTLAELRRTGAIARTAGGGLVFDGPIRDLPARLDRELAAIAVAAGATPVEAPSHIERDVLAAASYFELFGEGATRLPEAAADDRRRRAPALCYHIYAELRGQRIAESSRWTLAGNCHRLEAGDGSLETRLAKFRMREIVFFGERTSVELERARWMDRACTFAASLGLRASLVPASDPFFAPAGRGHRLIQLMKGLKYELQAAIDPAAPPVAIASMNLHEEFFTSRFAISSAEGKAISSGCAAFGIERWALALVTQLGIDRSAALLTARLAG